MKFFRKAAAIAAAAVCATSVAIAPAAQAAPAPGEYSRYVAIGDSFAAAGSLDRFIDPSRPACIRTSDNYPHQLANRLGLSGAGQFVDESCSFARLSDYWVPQDIPFPGANPRAQAQSITPDTDLVTLTLGGNPSHFAVIAACFPSAFGLNGDINSLDVAANYPPQLWPIVNAYKNAVKPLNIGCKNAAGAVAWMNKDFYWNYLDVVRDIQRRAPQADIRIVGHYDVIGDPTQTCVEAVGLSLEDRQYIKDFIASLNGVARQVAQDTGVVFVDPGTDTQGICAPHGTRESTVWSVTEIGVPFHPNVKGHTKITDAIYQSL